MTEPLPTEEAIPARARKSAEAYRTISEVADDLHVPQHVLRFWETKFPRIKPLKRGGGRRYYRPDDIFLLRRIADLLYNQGYTIKGVQRLLKEGGGALHDHIPLASAEERAAAAAERGDPTDLLAPLTPHTTPDIPSHHASLPPTPHHPSAPPPRAKPNHPAARDAELHRLRTALHAALTALEALRNQLT